MSIAEVIQIPAKAKQGQRKNGTWSMTYIRDKRVFMWHVEIKLPPITFTGECGTEAEAMAEINNVLKRLT